MRGGTGVEMALRCYPGWWRDRYADEVRAVSVDLMAEGRSPLSVGLNLLRGAIRARSRAQGLPRSFELWAVRTRVSVAAATLPWLLMAPLVVITMGTQSFHSSHGTVLYSGFFGIGTTHLQVVGPAGPVPAPPLLPAGWIALYSAQTITVVILVTLIVLAGGWSGLTGAIRRSSMPNRRNIWMLAWAPGFALLADLVLFIAKLIVQPHNYHFSTGRPGVPLDGHPAAANLLGTILAAVAIVGWLLSIVLVAAASKRAEVEPSDLRFGKTVSVVVATLLTALLAAYATWGVVLIVQARQSAHGNFTTITFSHQYLWLPMVLVLSLAALLSGLCARAAKRSWRVISVSFV